MRPLYLRVTYVGGRSEVAYLRLPGERGEKSVESERVEPEMVVITGVLRNVAEVQLLRVGPNLIAER